MGVTREIPTRGGHVKHFVLCRSLGPEEREKFEQADEYDRRRRKSHGEYLRRLGYEPGEALEAWDDLTEE